MYDENGKFNDKDLAEQIVEDILVPSSPKSSCWWSNLKLNLFGFKNRFEYVKSQHKEYLAGVGDGRAQEATSTIKACPAVGDILSNSFLIKSPADIAVTVDSSMRFVVSTANELISVQNHSIEQFHSEEHNIFEGKMNLKFKLPIIIRTDNIPLMFLQPMFHNNVDYTVVNGTISGKYTKGQPLNINILIDIPKGDEQVVYYIKAGDILAYLWSPEKLKLQHSEKRFIDNMFPRGWDRKSMY